MNKNTKLYKAVLDMHDFEELKDISEHGCASGTSLIYYSDTSAFHDKFEEDIWNLLEELAEDQGISILELICSFRGSKEVGSIIELKNLLSWFAIEEVASIEVNEREVEGS